MVAVPRSAFGAGCVPTPASVVVTDYAFRDAGRLASRSPPAARSHFSYPSGHRPPQRRTSPAAADVVHADRRATSGRRTPPLPWYTQGPGWAGDCTFNAPGHVPVPLRRATSTLTRHASCVASPTPHPDPDPDADAVPDRHADGDRVAGRDPSPRTRSAPARNWFQDASTQRPGRQQRHGRPRRHGHVQLPDAARASTTSSSTRASRRRARRPPAGDPAPRRRCRPVAQPAGWAGQLHASTTPGTYTFVCSVAPGDDRLGRRRGDAPVPTPTPTPTVTATPTATATRTPTPTATPIVGGATRSPRRRCATPVGDGPAAWSDDRRSIDGRCAAASCG